MASNAPPSLTPLQRAIYETDQLGINLRDRVRMVTQRMGFFVGQQRYLQERERIAAYVSRYGYPDPRHRLDEHPAGSQHQIGTP